ncbi:hypothetical protein [Rhodopirellula halodulae]|uniref:hypothetical protein n=1 Tax=Rhodopirellula halodulae TaxID=2894198 RepID=UPI001E455B7B|nr:hypothetical protein [Rhodopirellula sp. JC737]MCC9656748.1 hypothetical protein [Rhodopirellula sp. JC737]
MAIRIFPLIAITLLSCGCSSQNENPSQADVSSNWTPAELSERQGDLYSYLLSELEEPEKYVDLDEPDGRIYCLTLTPMDQWADTGNWRNIPTDFLHEHPELNTWYRPATDAYLKDGHVLTKDSDARAWMEWVTIRRWVSETEAEVQTGVWCCPLGGGASTRTYEKIDGNWRIIDYGESWVS